MFLPAVMFHAFPLLFIHAAYNAIWNPAKGSVTTFLQCKGCLSQSPFLSAAIVAAEIQCPRDMARDQVTSNIYNTHGHLAGSTMMIKIIPYLYITYGEEF